LHPAWFDLSADECKRQKAAMRVQPIDESDDFHKCEACGGWFDVRNLGASLITKDQPQ
jgi:hypothetical protein